MTEKAKKIHIESAELISTYRYKSDGNLGGGTLFATVMKRLEMLQSMPD